MITDNDEMNDDDGCGGGPRLAFTKIILKSSACHVIT